MSDQLLVSLNEAAQRLAVSRRLLQGLIYSGALPSLLIHRRRLVAVADLEHFVEQLRQDSRADSGGTDHVPALAVVGATRRETKAVGGR